MSGIWQTYASNQASGRHWMTQIQACAVQAGFCTTAVAEYSASEWAKRGCPVTILTADGTLEVAAFLYPLALQVFKKDTAQRVYTGGQSPLQGQALLPSIRWPLGAIRPAALASSSSKSLKAKSAAVTSSTLQMRK